MLSVAMVTSFDGLISRTPVPVGTVVMAVVLAVLPAMLMMLAVMPLLVV